MTAIDADKVYKAINKVRDARMALHAEFKAKEADLEEAHTKLLAAFTASRPDAAMLTTLHLRLRDDKKVVAHFAEHLDEDFKEAQLKVENVLLAKLLEQKAKSMNAGPATFYKEEVMKPSCTDWPAFYSFIKENDTFEALEKRVTKTFIQEYLDSHDGELPPGINIHRETVVRVRRGKES